MDHGLVGGLIGDVVAIDHVKHIALGVVDRVADLVLIDGAGLAVDVFVLGFTRDRIHGDDASHGGTLALAIHIHRRLDEGIQQAVVAVVGQSFEATAAAPLQINLWKCFLGEFPDFTTTLFVAIAFVATALGHDPMDQISCFGIMDRHLRSVFIGDGEHGVAVVEPFDAQSQHRLGIHAKGVGRHGLVSAIAIRGESG